MASLRSANARTKSNIAGMKNIGKGMAAYLTGVVPKTASLPARVLGATALGPVGDILMNPTEANAEDDVQRIKDFKYK